MTQRTEQVRTRLARLLGEDPEQLVGRTVLVPTPATPTWTDLPTPPNAVPLPTAASLAAVSSQWLIPPVGHQRLMSAAEPPPPSDAAPQCEPSQLGSPPRRWWQMARVDPTRRGVAAAMVSTVVVLFILGVLFGVKLWHRDATESAPMPVPQAAPPESSKPRELVVAVNGKVGKPGLVRLPEGSRVADAVQAAGGAATGTELGSLNLARKIVDGELIVVGGPQPAPPATNSVPGSVPSSSQPSDGTTGSPGVLLDLNSATPAQLDALPGVGPVTTQRILDYRTAHGRFGSVGELRKVDGIGEAKFAKLKPLVTV